jgi:hypothetical protein
VPNSWESLPPIIHASVGQGVDFVVVIKLQSVRTQEGAKASGDTIAPSREKVLLSPLIFLYNYPAGYPVVMRYKGMSNDAQYYWYRRRSHLSK